MESFPVLTCIMPREFCRVNQKMTVYHELPELMTPPPTSPSPSESKEASFANVIRILSVES